MYQLDESMVAPDAESLAAAVRYNIDGFTPYRDRGLAGVTRVRVYRNLNEARCTGRVCYSIYDRDTKLVVGHADKVAVEGAFVHINAAAQARIAAGGPRSVHAWVNGTLAFCPTDESPWYARCERVIYRPHEGPHFRYEQSDEVLWNAPMVRFDEHGMWTWA